MSHVFPSNVLTTRGSALNPCFSSLSRGFLVNPRFPASATSRRLRLACANNHNRSYILVYIYTWGFLCAKFNLNWAGLSFRNSEHTKMKASCSMPSLASIAEREVAMPLMTTFHPRRIPANSSSAFKKVRSETDLHNLDKSPQFYSHSPKLAIKSKHTSVESEAHTNPTRMGGFGITGGNGRGHSNKKKKNNGGDRDNNRGRDRDAYYQKMLEAHPGDPLLLRNYAGYLYEVGDELDKAEEYYERAVLANPGDGDVLAMYAKLLWESRNDPQRAQLYFDRAVQAAPDDCYVLGSHAHFLWNTEKDEEAEQKAPKHHFSYEPSSAAIYG